MAQYKVAEVGDDVPFWFGANDTGGSGADGASPVYDVRLAGAAAAAAPTASGSATLLSHVDYPAGAHEIVVDTDAYAPGEYGVFCTLLVDSENPTGFVGGFRLVAAGTGPVSIAADWANGGRLDLLLDAIPTTAMRGTDNAATAAKLEAYVQLLARKDAAIATDKAAELAEINADEGSGAGGYDNTTDSGEGVRDSTLAANVTQIGGVAQSATDLKDFADTGYDPTAHTSAANLTSILGTLLTETAGLLAGGFKKLFNVAAPTGTLNSLPDAVPGAAGGLGIADADGRVPADMQEISGDATAANNAESFFDGTGYAGTNNVIPTVTAVTNRVTANTDQIEGSDATDALQAGANAALVAMHLDHLFGTQVYTVQASPAPTLTSFTVSPSPTANDGPYALCVFTSGALANKGRWIATVSFGALTFKRGWPSAPSVGDTCMFLPFHEPVNSGLQTGVITNAQFGAGAIDDAAMADDLEDRINQGVIPVVTYPHFWPAGNTGTLNFEAFLRTLNGATITTGNIAPGTCKVIRWRAGSGTDLTAGGDIVGTADANNHIVFAIDAGGEGWGEWQAGDVIFIQPDHATCTHEDNTHYVFSQATNSHPMYAIYVVPDDDWAIAGGEMDLVDAPNATAITAIQSGLAIPGDQMDLVNAPNATAITAIQSGLAIPGDQMDLVNAPNATAITAIQSGLAIPGDQMDLVNAPNATAITAIQSGLATSANQTTILNRLGAWTGDAANNLLSAFRALFRKDADATVPPDINTDLGGGAGTADNTSDSVEAIRDRGDAAWLTGGGGSITQIIDPIPNIPNPVDLADTATWRIAVQVINSLDDLPSGAEITPGTISIDRKASGGTSWAAIVTDAAMSESSGLIYYDEVFDSATGYAQGDLLRITLKGQAVVADANTYEIFAAGGAMFYSRILGDESATGSVTVNFTVQIAGPTPVEGATIMVRASAGGANIRPGLETDALGQDTTGLDPGTYYVQAVRAGYVHAEEAVVVGAAPDPKAVTLTMTAVDVGAPANPAARRVWMQTLDPEGEYVTGRPAFTVELAVPCKTATGRIAQRKAQSTDAGDHSYAYADVLPTDTLTAVNTDDTVLYRVTIHATEEVATFALPTGDMSAINLETLI